MKKVLLYLIVLFSLTELCGCATSSEASRSKLFKEYAPNHKIIAILPLDNLVYERKDIAIDNAYSEEEKIALEVQQNIYDALSKKELSVKIQDINETNKLLADAGINIKDIRTISKDQLAGILGVDAILYGRLNSSKVYSDADVLRYKLKRGDITNGYNMSASPNRTTLNLGVFDRTTGEKIWRYDYKKEGTVNFNQAGKIWKELIKDIAKEFPYKV